MPAQKTPPTWLDNSAKAYWRKLYKRTDNTELLAVLCNALSQYRQASDVLAKQGILTNTLSGQPARHPALLIQKDAFQQIMKLRDILDESDEVDELAAIFGG